MDTDDVSRNGVGTRVKTCAPIAAQALSTAAAKPSGLLQQSGKQIS